MKSNFFEQQSDATQVAGLTWALDTRHWLMCLCV